jgi:hypothetical protein
LFGLLLICMKALKCIIAKTSLEMYFIYTLRKSLAWDIIYSRHLNSRRLSAERSNAMNKSFMRQNVTYCMFTLQIDDCLKLLWFSQYQKQYNLKIFWSSYLRILYLKTTQASITSFFDCITYSPNLYHQNSNNAIVIYKLG